MNKKVLVIALAILAAAMLATPLIGTTQACLCRTKITREPYHAQYTVHLTYPGTTEVKGDYTIAKGAIAQGAYDGPLGVGTMTAELQILVVNTVTGKAWSIFKNTLVINSGPYGAGTMVGFSWFVYANSPLPYDGGTLLCGSGNLKGFIVSAHKLTAAGGVVTEDGWLTHP
jgi:hypothetical protein